MAKLVITVQTYFKDGTHRNNRVEMQLPDEIAASIKNYWSENGGAYKCCEAWYLANNQSADCLLYEDNESDEDFVGLFGMRQEETQEKEVFVQHFKDEEEDDE